MEENVRIKTDDGHYIYGILNYQRKNTKAIVIFVHGMTGNSNEHQHFNCSRELVKHGVATFRFNLYSWEPQARQFDDCSLSTHANDLNRVVKFIKRKGYNKIGVVGHSLGAPTIFLADTSEYSYIVLWDPTSDEWLRKSFQASFDKRLGKYILNWGVRHLCSKELVDEMRSMPNAYKLLASKNLPTLIVAAGSGMLVSGCRKYFSQLTSDRKLVVIKNSGHCFDEEGTEERLIHETVKWSKKYF